MEGSRWLTFLFIIIGGAVALYAQAENQQNPYILILGILFLMVGLYRVSRNIPSKFEREEDSENQKEDV